MEQARQDARMLLDGLRGRHPAPLLPRPARARDLLQPHAAAQPSSQPTAQPSSQPTAQPTLRADSPDHAVEIVHVHMDDRTYEIQVQPGEYILDAALAAGLPMPFSCTVGGCGACMVECRAGVVDVEEPNCLTAAERQAGHVLICVGRPVGPVSIAVASPTHAADRNDSAGE
jgi:ferredoxin